MQEILNLTMTIVNPIGLPIFAAIIISLMVELETKSDRYLRAGSIGVGLYIMGWIYYVISQYNFQF